MHVRILMTWGPHVEANCLIAQPKYVHTTPFGTCTQMPGFRYMYLNAKVPVHVLKYPGQRTGTCGRAQRVARYICTAKHVSGTSQKHYRNAFKRKPVHVPKLPGLPGTHVPLTPQTGTCT